MVKLTKVIINSVTIKDSSSGTDPNKVIKWEYLKDSDAVSIAEITVINNTNDLVTLTNGLTIEIYGGNTTSTDQRLFYGRIDKIEPNGSIYELTCSNEMIDLVRKNVNKVYDSSIDASAGEISEIAKDLIETYGGLTASVQSSGTADGERVDQFKCINTDIFERLTALKNALNWDLYYNDATRTVHFEPQGFVDSGKTLNVKQEILGLPKWDIDTTNMINDLRVDGATIETTITESGQIGVDTGYDTTGILLSKTPNSAELLIDAADPPTTQREGGSKDASSSGYFYIDRENKMIMPAVGTTFSTNDYAIINYIWSSPAPIHLINQESIDNYGSFQKTIELNDITSVSDAEARASSFLAKRSVPFINGEIMVKLTDAPNRGELVNIVDDISPTVNNLSLSGSYVVNSIKYAFPSSFEVIEVGDSQWRLADWQQGTEERLKRLEEQFVRNQDIITELISIQNTGLTNFKKVRPRYRIITKRDLNGDGFVLGHTSYGILGTSTLGDDSSSFTDNFIQHYQNTYTEKFIDSDFKDNGTATWNNDGVLAFD